MKFNLFSDKVFALIDDFGLKGRVRCNVVVTSVIGDSCFVDVELSSVNHFFCEYFLREVLFLAGVYGADYRADSLVIKACCEYDA